MKIYIWLVVVSLLGVTTWANAESSPLHCSGGCRYSFDLSGKVQGINPSSPLYDYNGADYIVTGFFTNTGALNISELKVMPDEGA